MIRTFHEMKGGLAEQVERPETDEEIAQLKALYPPGGVPDGVIAGYEWQDNRLIRFTRLDPAYKAPAATSPPDSNRIDPVPTRERLVEWAMADLVTKAAELNVQHKAGETKAVLATKLIAAWTKRNAELAKPIVPPVPPPA